MMLLSAIVFTLFGALAGAIIVVRYWTMMVANPANARAMIVAAYRSARSGQQTQRGLVEKDGQLECPCCGWVERIIKETER